MVDGPDDVVALPESFGLPRRRYERLVADGAEPSAARAATSVILARTGADGALEVFLLHRVAEMAFAGGMTVFPGGGVDPRDRADSEDTTLRHAAIRELFEETGVLLAGPSATTTVDGPGPADARAVLTAGGTDLVTALAGAGLVPRADLLTPWARWVTPALMPVRYDLWVYLAEVPPGQVADGETTEAADAGWATPHDALSAWRAGERSLMPPTWVVLTELAAVDDLAGLRAASATRRLDPVTPEPLVDGERVRMAVPRWAQPPALPTEPSR